MNKQKILKIVISLLLASFAALGNIPYGYRFAYTIFSIDKPYIDILGYIFAATATLANIALGGYSLMSIEKSDLNKIHIVLLSIIGATPIGFICFLGYLNLLPIYIDIVLSIIVAFVNAGIGLRAMLNMLEVFSKIHEWLKKPITEFVFRVVGFVSGAAVSGVGYVAATTSLVMLFLYFQFSEATAMQLSYSIAVLTWIPSSALFAHSTQQVMSDIYKSIFAREKKSSAENKYLLVGIIVLSILSASALTQMVFELFKPENAIPDFLKNNAMQFFIYHILAPAAFFCSAAVNLFALRNLVKYVRG